jgi:hypothetical protein
MSGIAQRASLMVDYDCVMTSGFSSRFHLFNQLCINGLGLTNTISVTYLYFENINSEILSLLNRNQVLYFASAHGGIIK